jgi:hypothetical protein
MQLTAIVPLRNAKERRYILVNLDRGPSMDMSSKLRPAEAARYLRVAVSTLAKLRCYGGGPRFAKAGSRLVIYDRADLDAWLADRVCQSTAEYGAVRGRGR